MTPECPSCGKLLDDAVGIVSHGPPESGDLTVCLHCGAELEYHGKPGELRLRRLVGYGLSLARAHPHYRRAVNIVRLRIGGPGNRHQRRRLRVR
jgi:hypothetical protein